MPRPNYLPENNYEFPKTKFASLDEAYRRAVLSDDADVLKAAWHRAQHERKDPDLINYLHHRYDTMVKINDLERNKLVTADNRPKIEFIEEDANRKSLHLDKKEEQNTTNGCWSVSMQILLKAEGVELEQEEVRSFRPHFSDADMDQIISTKKSADLKTNRGIGENVDWEVMAEDKMGNVFDYSDLVMRTVPNTGVHDITWKPVTTQTKRAVADEILKIAKEAVDQKKPVSLLIGGHYRTIVGYDFNLRMVKIADSQESKNAAYESIDELIGDSSVVEATWLEKLKVMENGSIEGLPEHYKGISYEKGKLVPGPGYQEAGTIMQTKSRALKSFEVTNHPDKFLPNRQERFIAPAVLDVPQAVKDKQTAVGNDVNPGQGRQNVETEADDPVRNADRETGRLFDIATSGTLFKKMVKFAAEHGLYVSNRPVDGMQPYESVLSKFIAQYAVPDYNRGGESWFGKLEDELKDFERTAADIPDDPAHADWKALFGEVAQFKASYSDALNHAAMLHANVKLHEQTVLYGRQFSEEEKKNTAASFMPHHRAAKTAENDRRIADALNLLQPNGFHAKVRPEPQRVEPPIENPEGAERNREQLRQRAKSENRNRASSSGSNAARPLKPGMVPRKCKAYFEAFKNLYDELAATKNRLSDDSTQFISVEKASKKCLKNIEKAIDKGGMTSAHLMQFTMSELAKVKHACENYEYIHDSRNQLKLGREVSPLSERQCTRLCIMSRMTQLYDLSAKIMPNGSQGLMLKSDEALKERIALRLVDSVVTRLLTSDSVRNNSRVSKKENEYMDIRFKSEVRNRKIHDILSNDRHFEELTRNKTAGQLEKMLGKSDADLMQMYLKTAPAVRERDRQAEAVEQTRKTASKNREIHPVL